MEGKKLTTWHYILIIVVIGIAGLIYFGKININGVEITASRDQEPTMPARLEGTLNFINTNKPSNILIQLESNNHPNILPVAPDDFNTFYIENLKIKEGDMVTLTMLYEGNKTGGKINFRIPAPYEKNHFKTPVIPVLSNKGVSKSGPPKTNSSTPTFGFIINGNENQININNGSNNNATSKSAVESNSANFSESSFLILTARQFNEDKITSLKINGTEIDTNNEGQSVPVSVKVGDKIEIHFSSGKTKVTTYDGSILK